MPSPAVALTPSPTSEDGFGALEFRQLVVEPRTDIADLVADISHKWVAVIEKQCLWPHFDTRGETAATKGTPATVDLAEEDHDVVWVRSCCL